MFNLHSYNFNSFLNKQSKIIEIKLTNEMRMKLNYSDFTNSMNITVVETIFDKVYMDSELLNENFSFNTVAFNYKNLMSIIKAKLIELQTILIHTKEEKYNILIKFIDLYYEELMVSVLSGISIKKYERFSIIVLWNLDTKEIYNFRIFNNISGKYYKFNVKVQTPIITNYNRDLSQLINNLDKVIFYDMNNKYIEDDSSNYKSLINEIKKDILYEL